MILTVPTETVEGYAVALSSEEDIRALMKLKDRDFNSGKVFTLVPESKAAIKKYALIPDAAKPFIEKYLPGGLTLLLPKNPKIHHWASPVHHRRFHRQIPQNPAPRQPQN